MLQSGKELCFVAGNVMITAHPITTYPYYGVSSHLFAKPVIPRPKQPLSVSGYLGEGGIIRPHAQIMAVAPIIASGSSVMGNLTPSSLLTGQNDNIIGPSTPREGGGCQVMYINPSAVPAAISPWFFLAAIAIFFWVTR